MRPLLRTALASLGCAVLAACSDQPTSVQKASSVLGPNFTELPPPEPLKTLSCDINAMKADARLYANKSNDVLQTIIGDLGQLVRGGVVSNAGNDKAFDGLARMAAIRGTPDQKPGATGAVFDRLVKRFFGCMDPLVYAGVLEPNPPLLNSSLTEGRGFKQALGPGWVFEVRGKLTGPYADPPGGAYERAGANPDTWWALETLTGEDWAQAIQSTLTGDRALIFGYRTSDFLQAGGRAGSSFEHRTVPDVNPPSTVITTNVALCFEHPGDVDTEVQRINHANKFLELQGDANCNYGEPPPAITPAGSLAFGFLNPMRLARGAANFFGPQSLHASTAFFGGSITGRPDDFSPSAVYDLSQVKLVFDTISNGFVNTELRADSVPPQPSHEVRVYAFSLDPVPVSIPGVDVVVRIAGNSSTISFFGGPGSGLDSMTVVAPDSVIAKGTPQGYAKLTGVHLTKAGGYTLSARVNVVGVTGANLFLSNSFNIQNK